MIINPNDKFEKMFNRLRHRKMLIIAYSLATGMSLGLACWSGYFLWKNENLFYSEWTQGNIVPNEPGGIEVMNHLSWSIFYAHISPYLFISFLSHAVLASLFGVALIIELTGQSRSALLVNMYDEIQALKKLVNSQPRDPK